MTTNKEKLYKGHAKKQLYNSDMAEWLTRGASKLSKDR
jgi:hypothetical protein